MSTPNRLDPALEAKLLSVDSPTVSNAIERFKIRPRREGYMGPPIQCRFPDLGRVVGYATTCTIVEYDEAYPPDPRERFRWIEAIAESPKPAICVVKDCCHRKGWSSHWGEIVGTQVQTLGAAAIITDGAVRDLEALHAMGMKVWSEHVVVSHGYIDVGQANIPVEVGGLVVRPGDLLHADCNNNGISFCTPKYSTPENKGYSRLACVLLYPVIYCRWTYAVLTEVHLPCAHRLQTRASSF